MSCYKVEGFSFDKTINLAKIILNFKNQKTKKHRYEKELGGEDPKNGSVKSCHTIEHIHSFIHIIYNFLDI